MNYPSLLTRVQGSPQAVHLDSFNSHELVEVFSFNKNLNETDG